MNSSSLFQRILVHSAACVVLIAASAPGFAQNCETIDATAMGTSTQMGRIVNIKFRFCNPSSPEQRKTLVDAFANGKNRGLTDALEKMPSAGRISLPGTVGYDLAYVRVTPTPTGRQIRFVTNRKIAFGEAYASTRSLDYSLTAGTLDMHDKNKSKSTGVLYPAAAFRMNKKGELTIDLYQNPWKLQNIIDWKQ